MSTKGVLLRSVVKLLELVLPPARTPAPGSPDAPSNERNLDPPMQLAVRVVQTWADVNHVPLPRAFIRFSADRCPPSHLVHSEIHWAIKSLFTRIRDDHAALLEEKYRFKLELAVATAGRAWRLIEERDEDDEINEMDANHVVGAYAGIFEPSPA